VSRAGGCMALFWLALGWLAGIAAGQETPQPVGAWLAFAGAALLAAVLFRRLTALRWAFLGLLVVGLGAARSAAAQPPSGPQSLASFNGRSGNLVLEGVVIETPDVRDTYVGLRIDVDRVQPDPGQPLMPDRGRVLVYAARLETWAFGDRVQAAGRLETPPVFETFSYRDYLAGQGIHSLMREAVVTRLASRQATPLLQALFDYRARALRVVYRLFPDPEASLLAGILLGIETGIPSDVRLAFDRTGTSHIIAISGFNLTLVGGMFVGVFGRWLGPRRGAVAAGMAIAVYTLLVGADPPVVRAAIMAGIGLLARRLGRQTDAFASLGAAAWVMTAARPAALWDVGFQLSFAATLGLIVYAAPLQQALLRLLGRRMDSRLAEQLGGPLAEFGLFTLAAQAMTLPLMIYYFQRLSPASLIANPVILPAQPALMGLGGLAVLLGSIWPPLGQPLAWAAWPFAAFTIRVVEWFASWPMAWIPLGRTALPLVAGLYLILFGATALAALPADRWARWRLPAFHAPAWIVWTGLGAAAVLTWAQTLALPDGRLHLTALEVGRGEAVLIESPTGRFALVNGGASAIALSEGLGRRLPPFARRIDWLILASTDDERIGGIPDVVERFPMGGALIGGPPGGAAYRRVVERLTTSGCPIVDALPGQTLDLGGGAELEVLAVGERGAILQVTYGGFRALLAGGADPSAFDGPSSRRFAAPVTAVFLADGGDAAVNPTAWLAAVQPRVAIASLAAGDRRGLPSPETLLTLAGRTLLRTDRNGWIELITDGESLWVEVERSGDS